MTTRFPNRTFALLGALFLGAAASLPAAAPAFAEGVAVPYTIKDGKGDIHLYNGYRRYGDACLRCHGPDGSGGSYAPDLTESLHRLSEDVFKDTVINGRISTAKANSVMPPFGESQDVVLYLDDIYAYLKARSDGALGRGKPERFDK